MGGSNTSEGVQILQYMPEVSGPPGPNTSKYLDRGGPLPGGSNFSVTDPMMMTRWISLKMIVKK